MAVVEANVNALELEKVVPKLATAFERDDKFFSNIKKRNVEKMSNRQMRVPIALRPGGKFKYYNADGGGLGRGGGPTWDKAVVTSVFVAEAIEYTKLTEWSTNSDDKAIENAPKKMIADTLDELRRQLDSQMMGNGTGVLGTITTDTPAGGSNVLTFTTDGFGVRLMRFNQDVQVFDSTLVTNRGTATITQLDADNNSISLTPQIAAVVAGDVIVVDGISSPLSLPAIYGISYHHSNASTGTWLGFPRSTTPEIRASRVNGNNNAFALPLARLAINKIGNRVGIDNNMNPDAWMHPAQQQAYEEVGQLVSFIQKQPKDENLNMYFGGQMQMAGSTVKTSFNWDKRRIDFVTDSVWGRGEILPIGFYRSDGRNIFEVRDSTGGVATAELFYMTIGMQAFVNNPAACAYIDNLAVPAGYIS